MSDKTRFVRNVIMKGLVMFIALNLFWPILFSGSGMPSLYNHIFPGRTRLPFGETPEKAYNLSMFNINAMISSHELAKTKASDEFRVVVIGDSSIWGTLLRPEETLTGQINGSHQVTGDGKSIQAYNLGYPSMSLMKDMLIMDEVFAHEPDLIIWMVTLESFPKKNQLEAPLVANNPERASEMIQSRNIALDTSQLNKPTYWQNTLIGRRRELADIIRLQLYGVLWSATGIDQEYPEAVAAALRDFEVDNSFWGLTGPDLPVGEMAFDIISAGVKQARENNVPIIVINEPILISEGKNSDIRYNFYYPRWAYDRYRVIMHDSAVNNNWHYYDYWNLVPQGEFTNSAVHLSATGESILAEEVLRIIEMETD